MRSALLSDFGAYFANDSKNTYLFLMGDKSPNLDTIYQLFGKFQPNRSTLRGVSVAQSFPDRS